MRRPFYIDEFDSAIFKNFVCKLDLKSSISDLIPQKEIYEYFLKKNKVRYVFCNTVFLPENVSFLEGRQYRLVGTKILYSLKNESSMEFTPRDSFKIGDSTIYNFSLDKYEVIELINEISSTSHYAHDYFLPKNIHKRIYESWLYNTFHGYAQKVFVIVEHEKLIGLLSLREKKESFFIDLLGVRSSYRQKGLARVLVANACEYVRRYDKKLKVYTHADVLVNSIYQHLGFVVENFELIYHKVI